MSKPPSPSEGHQPRIAALARLVQSHLDVYAMPRNGFFLLIVEPKAYSLSPSGDNYHDEKL